MFLSKKTDLSKMNTMTTNGRISIGVAIATYNGAKYIEEQLNSILSQTRKPDVIVISDDVSTDGTIEKIKSIRCLSSTPIVIIENKQRLGVFDNFMQAFMKCETSYIAYCDQDDVWRKDKLELCERVLHRDPTISLIFHKSEIVDSQLITTGENQPHNIRPGLYRFPHIPQTLWGFGHQMIFSRDTLKTMMAIQAIRSQPIEDVSGNYDRLLLIAAGLNGGIFHLSEALTKFRRHDKTVSPAAKNASAQSNEFTRLRTIKDTSCLADNLSYFAKTHMTTRPTMLDAYLGNAKRVIQSNKNRQIIYEDPHIPKRLFNLAGALLNGAYGREKNNKLPPRVAVIDLLHTIGLRLER